MWRQETSINLHYTVHGGPQKTTIWSKLTFPETSVKLWSPDPPKRAEGKSKLTSWSVSDKDTETQNISVSWPK